MRVLVIDRDDLMRASLCLLLKSERFVVDDAERDEGVELAGLYDYDVIVMDGGADLIRELRRVTKAPIMVLTAMAKVETIVAALGAGADDHLTKPPHKDEFVARLASLVRRSHGHQHSVIQTGNLTLNISTKQASVDGSPIHLTGKEYQALELLALRKGAVQTKEAFLGYLYGGMDEPLVKIIDVFICKLRKKLKAAGAHQIETVWGRGYVLRDAPKAIDMSSEVRSLTDEPPTGYVSERTFNDAKRARATV